MGSAWRTRLRDIRPAMTPLLGRNVKSRLRAQHRQPVGYTPNLYVLTTPVKISGEPVANPIASTTGTDSHRVVKLIDAYLDEEADA